MNSSKEVVDIKKIYRRARLSTNSLLIYCMLCIPFLFLRHGIPTSLTTYLSIEYAMLGIIVFYQTKLYRLYEKQIFFSTKNVLYFLIQGTLFSFFCTMSWSITLFDFANRSIQALIKEDIIGPDILTNPFFVLGLFITSEIVFIPIIMQTAQKTKEENELTV